MLKLVQFESKFGLPNVSPFCMKVESFLRLAKIQYAMQFMKDPRKAPKGKGPYIIDDGEVIADSSFILEYLTKKYRVTLDQDLDSHKRGISRMISGTLEERLYFVIVYSRWIDDSNWPIIKELWFKDLPPVVRNLLPNMLRKRLKKTLTGQGIGRHNEDEIYDIGIKDLQAIVDILGDHKYIHGQLPTSIDATVFAFIANVLKVPLEKNPLLDFAADQPTLVDYCQRMGKSLFPEYSIFQ